MIKGSSFRLRTVMEQDLDSLLLLAGDIANHGDYLPIGLLSQNELRQDLQKDGMWGEDFKRLLMVNGEEEILGHLWIFKSVPYFDALEIGYTLFSGKDRGKGLISEAVGLLVDYLFQATQVNRLEIRCDVENEASAKVARKNGFTHEGVSRQSTFARGCHHDMHLFALLRSEWAEKRQA